MDDTDPTGSDIVGTEGTNQNEEFGDAVGEESIPHIPSIPHLDNQDRGDVINPALLMLSGAIERPIEISSKGGILSSKGVDEITAQDHPAETASVAHSLITETPSLPSTKKGESVADSLSRPMELTASQKHVTLMEAERITNPTPAPRRVVTTAVRAEEKEALANSADRHVKIDENTKQSLGHWPTSRSQTAQSRTTGKQVNGSSVFGDRPTTRDTSLDLDKVPRLQKFDGTYEEIPNVMDGFRMLNRGVSRDPEHVYSLSLVGEDLIYVIEDDLALFKNLINLNVNENTLPFARLGVLPSLKKLVMSCNNVGSLDLEVEGRFENLEYLDLSFNSIDQAAQLVLSTLPKLSYLDLSSNNITSLCKYIANHDRWQEKVIELLLPSHVAELDAQFIKQAKSNSSLASAQDESHVIRSINEAEKDQQIGSDHEGNNGRQVTSAASTSSVEGSSHSGRADSIFEEPIVQDLLYDSATKKDLGFCSLDTLILEDNRLGIAENPEFWYILADLPNLRILNVSKNKIQTLRPLIPETLAGQIQDPIDLLSLNPQVLKKMKGFKRLTELYLTSNKISTFDDLIGLICLQRLKNVYLEGNPVMKEFIPKHLKKIEKSKDEFNLFHLFSSSYGIHISDLCYQPSRAYLNDSRLVSIKPDNTGVGVHILDKQKLVRSQRKKLGEILQRNPRPSSIPHLVQNVPILPPKEIVYDRQKRRHYEFTEDDLKEIVKKGRIPPVSELMKLAEKREKQAAGIAEESPVETTQNLGFEDPAATVESVGELDSELGEPITESMEQLFYDPARRDDTFLTGVHITGSNNQQTQEEEPSLDESESDYSSTDQSRGSSATSGRPSASQFDRDDPDELDEADRILYPLPRGIQASVRALRHALSNPVAYWRMMEESYAKPTIASIQKEENAAWTKDVMSETHGSDGSSNSDVSELLRGILVGSNVSSESSTKVSALNTPANSVWTPTHSAPEGTFPLDDFVIPTLSKAKNRFIQGAVSYRTKEDLILTAQMNDKDLHRELNARLQMNLSQNFKAKGEEVVLSKEQLPQLQTRLKQRLGPTAALQRAQRDGRLRPKDEFEELNDIMLTVDKKINTIEANLAHVLRNSTIRKHIPKSRQLFEELQKEYERIENMYLADAKAVIQSEPLSHRLVKLGVGNAK